MDKELQNKAWSVLPKEFKEEVKKLYTDALDASNSPHEPDDRKWGNYRVALLEKLFGIHNLTSDAEGEEMLYADKSKVQKIFAGQTEVQKNTPCEAILHYEAAAKTELLYTLFGSKCLTDEEPKPAEPKYHAGDWVRVVSTDKHGHIGQITEVEYEYGCNYYQVFGAEGWHFLEKNLEPYTKPAKSKAEPKFKLGDELVWDKRLIVKVDEVSVDGKYLVYSRVGNRYVVKESDLEPYTEPGKNIEETHNLSQDSANCDKYHTPDSWKMIDNILKNSIAKERRLAIAAQMMQGLICAPLIPGVDPNPSAEYLAQAAFRLADALIAEWCKD